MSLTECLRTNYVLVLKSEGKRQIGRYRRRWEDDLEMDLNDRVWEDVESSKPQQWTFSFHKMCKSLDYLSNYLLSRSILLHGDTE
jgi:hypothetical protein